MAPSTRGALPSRGARTVSLLSALALLRCVAGAAQASTIALPRTGQASCFDQTGAEMSCEGTGQDGEHRGGVPWAEGPRFQTIMPIETCNWDSLTGLWWPKNANASGMKMTWAEAMDYVQTFEACGFALQSWRLPNANELESLINAGVPATSTWLLEHDFTNTQGDSYGNSYWTSTSDASFTDAAWAVDLGRGNVTSIMKRARLFVWLVHGGTEGPGQLWETGQTASYASGDDGDLEAGVTWPAPRFTDHGDGTVTDELTGLMWTRDAGTPGPARCNPGDYKPWDVALTHLQCINTHGLSGHNDWRLPNRKELFSLLDRSQHDPALPVGHPFTNVAIPDDHPLHTDQYWTSTSVVAYPDSAFYVAMGDGQLSEGWKGHGRWVWPVRSGGTTTPTHTLSVSKPGTGTGTVVSDPAGVDCPTTCTSHASAFDEGSSVTVTATPDATSLFAFWTGACRGPAPACTVAMTSDVAVNATFVPSSTRRRTLAVKRAAIQRGDGAVASDDGMIRCDRTNDLCKTQHCNGLKVTLTATVDYPNTFLGWRPAGLCPGTAPCTFSMTRARTIGARFDGGRRLTIRIGADASGGDSVRTPHVTCAAARCTDLFRKGEAVTLTAVPATGSTFRRWIGGPCREATNPVCSLTMDRARSVRAVFASG